MAKQEGSSNPVLSANRHLRQLHLFSLIARLCAPRRSPAASDVRRVIVDSRLNWSIEQIDGQRSWLYLDAPAQVREVAGCLVLTADKTQA